MVRCFYGIVHLTFEHFQVLTGQDMVDTDIKTVAIIRYAQSIPRLHECILQLLAKHTVGIRYGGIIEIATNNQLLTSQTPQRFSQNVGLLGTNRRSFRHLLQQLPHSKRHILLVWSIHHVLISFHILPADFIGLQMIVDDDQGTNLGHRK